MEKLMTLEEVAKYLRLSVHTLYKMAQEGRIPALKAGTQWRFKKEEVDHWLKTSNKPKKKKEEH
ncbi:MAG: helix-turn-helix domain-containing protein [Endomicrobiia bacterium]